MALSCVGHILACLKKDSLVRICDERGLSYYGNKSLLHHRLRSSFRGKPAELLTFLRKNDLRLVCEKSEINISGNIDDLIKRIMSVEICQSHFFSESSYFSEDYTSSEEESDDSKEKFESELPERYSFIGCLGNGGFGEAFLVKITS